MPRKQFLQDVERAVAAPGSVPFVHDLCRGEDDGQISFLFSHASLALPVRINALIPELSDYPTAHDFMVYADDDAPATVADIISSRLCSVGGLSVQSLLELVSRTLSSASTVTGHDYASSSDLEMEDTDDNDDDDGDIYSDQPFYGVPSVAGTVARTGLQCANPTAFLLLQEELRYAKHLGFRVGTFGAAGQDTTIYVTVACRIKKLDLSDEAVKAWQLKASNYIILAIRYANGYRTYDSLQAMSKSQVKDHIDFRVGTGSRYKPTSGDLIEAFQAAVTTNHADAPNGSTPPKTESTFGPLFISRPLTELLTTRLLQLIGYRQQGMSWFGAEAYYEQYADSANRLSPDNLSFDERFYLPDDEGRKHCSLMKDNGQPDSSLSSIYVIVLGMQFMLRRFVRCSEFCLICHRKMDNETEALKPYVCDKPLCLYQYMNLGFGPKIEHEIMAEPLVVDLLISFCYSAAAEGGLKSFPNGLNIMVPANAAHLTHEVSQRVTPKDVPAIKATIKLSPSSFLMTVAQESDTPAPCPFKVGQWIVCVPERNATVDIFHCRVLEANYYPSITVSQPLHGSIASISMRHIDETTGDQKYPPRPFKIDVYFYETSFDSLSNSDKSNAIRGVLNTLPSVESMRNFIADSGRDLKDWRDAISPAALSVLRWIIASNRACIFHLSDKPEPGAHDQRVYGMQGWHQFRFAMGAPDKEQRFVKAVRENKQRLNLKIPTIFAWHGSLMKNWHGIVREGLNYNTVVNGRAYGDGCYHSLSHQVSAGYSGAARYGPEARPGWYWSALNAGTAMSLNEIVNAPDDFTSKSPHLVVQHVDWIQTRYLFVLSQPDNTSRARQLMQNVARSVPKNALPQDPTYTPHGLNGPLIIPAGPISVNRNLHDKRKITTKSSGSTSLPKKSAKRGAKRQQEVIVIDSEPSVIDEDFSEESDDEDRRLLMKEVQLIDLTANTPPRDDEPIDLFAGCRFTPGKLDHTKLPIMPQPSYASTATTKRLQKDFLSLLKVQESTAARELGWYINPEKFDNVYQWIVELHSFDLFELNGQEIPLARDLKNAGVESVVMEMRFGASYPMSPPFVRVIRPRFLGFQQGGGGHITAGGAMCMQLLTNDGWTAATGLEAVLLQVRLAIASTDPKPARLDPAIFRGRDRHLIQYGTGEAVEAYKRACRMHGWTIPSDFEATAAASNDATI